MSLLGHTSRGGARFSLWRFRRLKHRILYCHGDRLAGVLWATGIAQAWYLQNGERPQLVEQPRGQGVQGVVVKSPVGDRKNSKVVSCELEYRLVHSPFRLLPAEIRMNPLSAPSSQNTVPQQRTQHESPLCMEIDLPRQRVFLQRLSRLVLLGTFPPCFCTSRSRSFGYTEIKKWFSSHLLCHSCLK